MSASMPRILSGYKVVDFTPIVAGPTCTLMLAEMGAEVIKVELAPAGDPSRGAPVVKHGRSGYFVQHNRGKKGVCVDVKSAAGHDIVAELIRKADVMVENFAPGTITRLGFDFCSTKQSLDLRTSQRIARKARVSARFEIQLGPGESLRRRKWAESSSIASDRVFNRVTGPPETAGTIVSKVTS